MAFAAGARYTIFTNERMQPGDERISIRISIIVTAFVPPSATENNAIPKLIWRSFWTTHNATLVAHITFGRDAFASTKFYYHARIVPQTSREIRSSDHHPLVARTFFFCIYSGPFSRSKKLVQITRVTPSQATGMHENWDHRYRYESVIYFTRNTLLGLHTFFLLDPVYGGCAFRRTAVSTIESSGDQNAYARKNSNRVCRNDTR